MNFYFKFWFSFLSWSVLPFTLKLFSILKHRGWEWEVLLSVMEAAFQKFWVSVFLTCFLTCYKQNLKNLKASYSNHMGVIDLALLALLLTWMTQDFGILFPQIIQTQYLFRAYWSWLTWCHRNIPKYPTYVPRLPRFHGAISEMVLSHVLCSSGDGWIPL